MMVMSDSSLRNANNALWLAWRRGWVDRLPDCLEEVCDSPLSIQNAARLFGLFWSFGHDSFFDAKTFLEMMELDKTKTMKPKGVHFMDALWIPEVKRQLELERREHSN
jgi:hypothetical protein